MKRELTWKKICYYNLDLLLKIVIIVAKNHCCYLWEGVLLLELVCQLFHLEFKNIIFLC